jgi:hypothetical protein
MSAENNQNPRVHYGGIKPPLDEIQTCIEMRAALDGERLLIETRHGKEVAELSMELFDGLLHAASEMAKEAGLAPGLVIGTTIQLLRPWTNARTRSCATAQRLARTRKHQKRWNKNTTECRGGASQGARPGSSARPSNCIASCTPTSARLSWGTRHD